MKKKIWLAGVAVVAVAVVGAQAKQSASDMVSAMIACSDIVDSTQRLSCFDGRVAELKAARTKKPAAFSDRSIRREEAVFQEINTKIVNVSPLGYGTWLLVLADNSVWQTTELARFDPATGSTILIKKGRVAGYRALVNGRWTVPVRRLK
jgi:hypothetical protein